MNEMPHHLENVAQFDQSDFGLFSNKTCILVLNATFNGCDAAVFYETVLCGAPIRKAP